MFLIVMAVFGGVMVAGSALCWMVETAVEGVKGRDYFE